jgi:hypothetical protein
MLLIFSGAEQYAAFFGGGIINSVQAVLIKTAATQ